MMYQSDGIPTYTVVIRLSAEEVSRWLASIGVSHSQFCRAAKLPKRTFDAWMANRSGSTACPHTSRGPRRLLRLILQRVQLPRKVENAIFDVLEYEKRFLLK